MTKIVKIIRRRDPAHARDTVVHAEGGQHQRYVPARDLPLEIRKALMFRDSVYWFAEMTPKGWDDWGLRAPDQDW